MEQLWGDRGNMGAILSIGMGEVMVAMGMDLQGLEVEVLVGGEEDAHCHPRRTLCHKKWQGKWPKRRK